MCQITTQILHFIISLILHQDLMQTEKVTKGKKKEEVSMSYFKFVTS